MCSWPQAVSRIGAKLSRLSARLLLTASDLELLYSITGLVPSRLTDIDVTLRVHSQGVCKCQFANLVSCATETRQDLPTRVIEDIHLFIIFIQHEHELLCTVGRKAYPLGRSPPARY